MEQEAKKDDQREQVRRDAEPRAGLIPLLRAAVERNHREHKVLEWIQVDDLEALLDRVEQAEARLASVVEAALQVLDITTSDEVNKEARRALVAALTVYEQSQGNTE